MTNKQIIDGKECKYWFRFNPDDYRKCSLRGKNDNCDEIKDCFVKELLGKLALKEQECEELKETLTEIKEFAEVLITMTDEYDSCYYKDRCYKCEVKDECQYFKVEQILQKSARWKNERTDKKYNN